MKNHFLIIASIFIVILSACQSETSNNNTPKKEDKLNIVVTTGMIKDAVENVVGDKATVTALMGPGVDPHLYKATPGDVKKLQNADVIFYNGLYLEAKLEEILGRLAARKPVFVVTDGIDRAALLKLSDQENEKYVYDPHIWFDVQLWKVVVDEISHKMQSVDSVNTMVFKENASKHIKALQALDANIHEQITSIPPEQRVLITSHDAFGYFARAYGVAVEGLQGVSTLAEAGLRDVKEIRELIIARKVKAVFVESSVPQKALEAVVEGCKKEGHEVKIGGTLFADAMGKAGTPEGTYIGMVQHNIKTIVNGLK